MIVGPSATTTTAAITAIATDTARDLAGPARERRTRAAADSSARHRRGRRAAARRAWPRPSTRAASSCRHPRTTRGAARRARRPRAATTTTRRVGNDGSASTPSSAAAAPASGADDQRAPGSARRDRADRAERDRERRPRPPATATRAPPRRRAGRRRAGLHGRTVSTGQPVGRRRRARPAHALARAGDRARARSATGAETGPSASLVQHQTRAARRERGAPDAGRAARGVLDRRRGRPLRSTTSATPSAARRFVLAHDQRPAARARRPVHEPGRVAGDVRPDRAHGVAPPADAAWTRSTSAPSPGQLVAAAVRAGVGPRSRPRSRPGSVDAHDHATRTNTPSGADVRSSIRT